jgi:hypothetical protein
MPTESVKEQRGKEEVGDSMGLIVHDKIQVI